LFITISRYARRLSPEGVFRCGLAGVGDLLDEGSGDDGNNIRIFQELGKESEEMTLRMLVKGISDISERGLHIIRANAPKDEPA